MGAPYQNDDLAFLKTLHALHKKCDPFVKMGEFELNAQTHVVLIQIIGVDCELKDILGRNCRSGTSVGILHSRSLFHRTALSCSKIEN